MNDVLGPLGLKEIYSKYLFPRYSEKYEQQFDEHCRNIGHSLVRGTIILLLGIAILTWPVDYYLYSGNPRLLEAINIWRGTTAVTCFFMLSLDGVLDLSDQRFLEVFLTGVLVIAFAIYYSLGNLGGLDTPWFYSAYCMPFLTLFFFNVRFPKRVTFTTLITLAAVFAYFGLHPEHLNSPYAGTPLLLVCVFTICSIVLGQTIHNMYKRSYIQSQRLEETVREKETLLEEIHHRVKNNMQVITSMLNMHARESASEEFEKQFEEVINRVKSMALIHETLYQSEHLSRVDLPEYIRNLCDHLVSTYSSSDPVLEVDVIEAEIDMDKAIACGLIVNEAVTNALEHGLRGAPDDRLEVSIRRRDNGMVQMKISDNGRGLGEDFTPEGTSSTGVFLIQSLAGYELNGSVDFIDDGGLTVLVRFELD